MPKQLKTRASVWTNVFRTIVTQLENDPDVRRVVGTQNIRSWKGIPADKSPMTPTASSPVVRLTPQPGHMDWFSPESQIGPLSVKVEIAVTSLCIDDVLDLWDTIVEAIRPAAESPGSLDFMQKLIAAGAETGEIVFTDPAVDPNPAGDPEGQFFATGYFALNVIRTVNP